MAHPPVKGRTLRNYRPTPYFEWLETLAKSGFDPVLFRVQPVIVQIGDGFVGLSQSPPEDGTRNYFEFTNIESIPFFYRRLVTVRSSVINFTVASGMHKAVM